MQLTNLCLCFSYVDARRPAPSFVLGGDKATAVDPAAWGNLVPPTAS